MIILINVNLAYAYDPLNLILYQISYFRIEKIMAKRKKKINIFLPTDFNEWVG